MPATSTSSSVVSVFAGFASQESTVSITDSFTLVGGAPKPSYPPTKAPTSARTVVVFPLKITLTSIAAATFNAATGEPATLIAVVKQILTTLLQADATAVDAKLTTPAVSGVSSSIVTSTFHLQASASCLLALNVTVIRELTPYATTAALTTALSTALVSTTNMATLLAALKQADVTTFGGATAHSVAVSAPPVVNTLQTAAPSSLPVSLVSTGDGEDSSEKEGRSGKVQHSNF
jgi:hypothetical protein